MTDARTAVVVFLLAFARSLADGIGPVDESWFLQVVARIRSGEVLYRDVFFGATPLSVYVTTGLTVLTGIEVVAVKLVTNACFAATTVLTGRLARGAGLSTNTSWGIMAAVFVWGRPYLNPPYTPMAMMFFVAALVAVQAHAARAHERDRSRVWVVAGALAGLSFVAKQNVGLLALLAVGCVALIDRTRAGQGSSGWTRPSLVAAAGFAVAAALVLVPVALTGGLPRLWDYGFAAKDAYVRAGSVSYLDSVTDWLGGVLNPFTQAGLASGLHGLVVVLPVAVLVVVMSAVRVIDRRGWTLVLFACIALATAFPRWDRFHMAYAVPVHLVALCYVIGRRYPVRTGRSTRRSTGRLAAAGVIVAAVAVAAQPLVSVIREHRRPASLPHFTGPFLPPGEEERLASDADRLRRAAEGWPVFILSYRAGLLHLTSGVPNPTPFDIPGVTSVGSDGVPWLLNRLAGGQIDRVCLENGPPRPRALESVAAWVRARFEPGPDVGPCTVFRRRSHTAVNQEEPR